MLVDCEDKELKIGQRVVYNKSGDLATGEIVAIKEQWRYHRYMAPYFTGYVAIRQFEGHVSKVRNLKGIFVLER